jgi:hypothetical protein
VRRAMGGFCASFQAIDRRKPIKDVDVKHDGDTSPRFRRTAQACDRLGKHGIQWPSYVEEEGETDHSNGGRRATRRYVFPR